MSHRIASLVCSVVLVVACSDSSGGPHDVSETSDATDAGDTAPDGSDVVPGTPILARAGRADYVCTETLAPVGSLGPSWYPLAFAAVGDTLWLLRSEGGIKLSTFGSDGALGADIELGGPEWAVPGGVIAAADGVMTLVWSEPLDAGGEQLRVALVSTSGEVLAAPTTLPGTPGQEASSPRMLPTTAGHRLVWLARDGGNQRIRNAFIEDGAFVGEPTTLVDLGAAYGGSVLGLVADADGPASPPAGFALAWNQLTADYSSEVWFQSFASDGTARHDARRISREGKDGVSSGAAWRSSGEAGLVRAGDRYLAAFTEDYQRPGSDFSELGHAVLQIAVVDETGEGALTPLSAPVEGRTSTAASFYRLGDALGLYWAEGTIIRICGGCYVDYVLRTVLLDAATLDPRSLPATHAAQDHGFNYPRVAVLGSDVVSVSLQDFHALSRPATAVMRCTASP